MWYLLCDHRQRCAHLPRMLSLPLESCVRVKFVLRGTADWRSESEIDVAGWPLRRSCRFFAWQRLHLHLTCNDQEDLCIRMLMNSKHTNAWILRSFGHQSETPVSCSAIEA
jgi:hypothetical protein